MKECLFCKIAGKQIPAKIVYEDERVVAFRDINPKAPVHILIIPRKHIETVMDVKSGDRELMGDLFIAARKIAEKEGVGESGFRLIQNCKADAGQEVFHIHFHLLAGRKLSWPHG